MEDQLIKKLAEQLRLDEKAVKAAVILMEDGATIPFIARYRKELTNSLDEVELTAVRDGMKVLDELEKRRQYILEVIEEQGKLTPQLKEKLLAAETITVLEDLYLPYKPKKRTRATIAKEKGLEPLAKTIFLQRTNDIEREAARFVNAEKGVEDVAVALAGARDIIAERVSEDPKTRANMRRLFSRKGFIISKVARGKEQEARKYKDYFQYEEPVNRIPSHRFLAMMRGEKEELLRVSIEPDMDRAMSLLERQYIRGNGAASDQVYDAIEDSYKRLLRRSIETEIRKEIKEKSDKDAIDVFATNLRKLLLSAPLGEKRVLAIDPGFRTGCKVVCLDEHGTLLEYATIFPHDRTSIKRFEAIETLENLCDNHQVKAIAIGNGTGGRETYQFIKRLQWPDIDLVLVDESGASIYSASAAAREEFPDHDLTVRGSVSIGRRLMDPLAELVKIDPKSIGVGQYQHDVNQKLLQQSLDDVVMSCVNKVGVEINTASKQLLTYVSGLGPKTAENVVNYRNESGGFTKKGDLMKVKGVGKKAFEQAAGFIRIRNASNPLDASAVHPESFKVIEKIAQDLEVGVQDMVGNKDLLKEVKWRDYVTDKVGLPTLKDIESELLKPGRDPRQDFEVHQFADGIQTIEDIEEGMILPGVVTNVTNFGAFVDIGIKENGLIHISQLANKFVKDPKKIVSVNQKVQVKVISLDVERKRIGLKMS